MQSNPTNVAQRLLDVYDSLREMWATNPGVPGLQAMRLSFAAFREPDVVEDESAFMSFVADVFALPISVLTALEALDAHELEWAAPDLEDIRNGLSMTMLLNNVSVTEPWLNDAHRKAIQAAVTRLNRSDQWREEALPVDAVAALLATVRNLRDQVLGADDIPADVRSWLVAMISEIETSLSHYRVDGANGLKRALESAAGQILFSPEAVAAAKTSNNTLWERTLSVLKTAERAVLFAAGGAYLLSVGPGIPWHDSSPVHEVIMLIPATNELEPGMPTRLELEPAQTENEATP